MSAMFILPKQYVPALDGGPLMGARANFYIIGTTTRKNTYIDAALTEAHPNPVEADSFGVLPVVWLDESGTDYRVVITDQFDVAQYTIDGLLSQTTPSDLLNSIKTVDGVGSGLDADLFDGLNSDAYAVLDEDESITGLWNFTGENPLFGGEPMGFRGIPVRSVTAQHELRLDDNGRGVSSTTGGLVVPVTSTFAFQIGPFDVGHCTVFLNDSAVNQQITADVPATTLLRLAGTASTGTRTVGPHGVAVVYQQKLNEWWIYGTGVS